MPPSWLSSPAHAMHSPVLCQKEFISVKTRYTHEKHYCFTCTDMPFWLKLLFMARAQNKVHVQVDAKNSYQGRKERAWNIVYRGKSAKSTRGCFYMEESEADREQTFANYMYNQYKCHAVKNLFYNFPVTTFMTRHYSGCIFFLHSFFYSLQCKCHPGYDERKRAIAYHHV